MVAARAWGLVTALVLMGVAVSVAPAAGGEVRVLVDPVVGRSGLLERILPAFEAARGARVVWEIRPSKEALEAGAAGRADAVWVHAPRQELQYLNQGFYLDRRLVLAADYVLAGPPADPARVRGLRRVVAAFRRIAERRAPFVSAGDGAGSQALERELWQKAGVTPGPPWYTRAAFGREAALAAERGAYVLLPRRQAAALPAGLRVLLEGVRPLRRAYHWMEVNPHRFAGVNHAEARALGDYLLSSPTQQLIGRIAAEGASFVPAASP